MTDSRLAASAAEQAHTRIVALDVIRGIAILGTLGTNIWLFTDPLGPTNLLAGLQTDGVVERILLPVTNGKLLALLTLMFGIGLELQYRSAVRRGQRWPGRYLWRATLLFVEGLLHYILIFEFDVLMGYALVAIVVSFLIGRSRRVLTAWIVAQAMLGCLLVALITAGGTSSGGSTGPSLVGEPATGWLEQVRLRLEAWPLLRAEIVLIIPFGIALFGIGALLLRAGAFADDDTGARLRRRLMWIGLGFGVPLNVLTAAGGADWFFVDRYISPPLVALGLLGLIPTVLYRMRPAAGPIRHGLTSVGRTALSCYVFQNLLASVLCYPWGLGLAERLDRAQPGSTVLLWLLIVATFMVLSTLWLRRFRRGPLEAAWQWAYEWGRRPRDVPPSRDDRT